MYSKQPKFVITLAVLSTTKNTSIQRQKRLRMVYVKSFSSLKTQKGHTVTQRTANYWITWRILHHCILKNGTCTKNLYLWAR